MRISILSNHSRFTHGFHDFFPFYRWSRDFAVHGHKIKMFYDHRSIGRAEGDVAIVSNRYFRPKGLPRTFVIDYLKALKNHYNRIVWFDAVDTSGIVDFDIIEYVDLFLKKQILRDRTFYTKNLKDRSVRVWLNSPIVQSKYEDYVPCPPHQLYKIKVGWNIGLCDFRNFSRYTGVLKNFLFANPRIEKVDRLRSIGVAYRGTMNYGNPDISFQRNKILSILKRMERQASELNIVLGGKVSRANYVAELRNSKVSVSPFGWGEICYRDFESILAGSVLLKPSMDHIDTFPNIYGEDRYIKIDWHLEDFETKMMDTLRCYDEWKILANNAQSFYKPYITDSKLFVDHLIKTLNSAI